MHIYVWPLILIVKLESGLLWSHNTWGMRYIVQVYQLYQVHQCTKCTGHITLEVQEIHRPSVRSFGRDLGRWSRSLKSHLAEAACAVCTISRWTLPTFLRTQHLGIYVPAFYIPPLHISKPRQIESNHSSHSSARPYLPAFVAH